MFLAWNEIKRNKLKFSLIISILIMISYLLFLLSGLANGLINMNTEGINKWNATSVVLNKNANTTLAQSKFDQDLIDDQFTDVAKVRQPGVIASNGDIEENALIYGLEENSFIVPKIVDGTSPSQTNEVAIDKTLHDKGFNIDDTIEFAQSDVEVMITAITESAKYNASGVMFGNMELLSEINPQYKSDEINAAIVKDEKFKKADLDDSLEVVPINTFIEQLPGYTAQNLTLNFMITFLFIISAAVIGIFLYVITLQKTSLFGVLKAQGFTNGYLAKMVFSQTLILSLIGTVIGILLTIITGLFLPEAVPIAFNPFTLLLFAIILITVSLLGGIFSVLSIRKVDPLKAIG